MASRVHLVRHGEVENPDHVVYASLPGFRLSEHGRRQAREAARHLASQPVTAVWSSPLERALETAAIVAVRLQLPVRVDAELVEWRLLDQWAGTPWDEVPHVHPGQLEDYLGRPHDLAFARETLEQLATRMRTAVDRIARGADGDVVVVGHQDPVQAARLRLTGRPLDRLQEDKPRHASVITLRPGTPWREEASWSPEGD